LDELFGNSFYNFVATLILCATTTMIIIMSIISDGG